MIEENKIIGKKTLWYPSCMNSLPVTVVLVAGGRGDDYAAYCGIGEDVDWIARRGDKISFAEAKIHFPSIEIEHYRS